MKTKATIDLENALDQRSINKREYGCKEVTIGFQHDGHGDEIVDYMSMDASGVFRCYELKVSLADLKTDNKKSWYGDYNYLVVSQQLWLVSPDWENYIPPYVGILVGEKLTSKRQAKKHVIREETREMLKDSLLRTLFWKMRRYEEASDLHSLQDIEKQLQQEKDAFALYRQSVDAKEFNYDDYEQYYRMNHQDSNFSIEKQAKVERSEYFARKQNQFHWQEVENKLICPKCHREAMRNQENSYVKSDFCPWCGADLRYIL